MKPSPHGRHPAAAAVCAALMLVIPQVGRAANHYVLSTHVPAEISSGHLKPLGDLADTNRLHLAIGLPLRNKPGLDKLLTQLYDPKSPNYHQYLTVAQFTESFGPSQADYDALHDF